jgi:hypothetical protein
MRFTLAYLWSVKRGDQAPFVELWRAIASKNNLFRFQDVDRAVAPIYNRIGWVRKEGRVDGRLG